MAFLGLLVIALLTFMSFGQSGQQISCKCMPNRFHAMVTSLQTANSEIIFYQEMHVFFPAKRIAVKLYSHNVTSGHSTYLKRIVTHFDLGRQYTIQASNASDCTVKSTSLIQPPQCVTEPGAKLVGSTYLGSPYGPPLLVDTWRFVFKGPLVTQTMAITIGFSDHYMAQPPSCVPIFQTVSPFNESDNGQVMMFSDFKPTINLTLFDTKGCPSP